MRVRCVRDNERFGRVSVALPWFSSPALFSTPRGDVTSALFTTSPSSSLPPPRLHYRLHLRPICRHPHPFLSSLSSLVPNFLFIFFIPTVVLMLKVFPILIASFIRIPFNFATSICDVCQFTSRKSNYYYYDSDYY